VLKQLIGAPGCPGQNPCGWAGRDLDRNRIEGRDEIEIESVGARRADSFEWSAERLEDRDL